MESLARECRAVREAHGPQDPRLCGPLVAMAQRLVQLESPSEADVLLRRALTLRQTPALIASFDTVDLLDTLADVNDSLGATLPAAAFRDQSAALLSSLREKHAESSTCGCSRLDVSLEALVRLALLVSTLTRYSLISTVYLALFCVVSYLSPLLAFPLGHIQSSTLRWKLSASVAVVAVLACILRALYAILAKRGDAGHVYVYLNNTIPSHCAIFPCM